MTSREIILGKIRKNKPESIEHPGIPDFSWPGEDPIDRFGVKLSQIGGEVQLVESYTEALQKVDKLEGNVVKYLVSEDRVLNDEEPETTVINGELAVVENAAVFVNVDRLPERFVPFLGERLIVLVQKDKIYKHLHEAYDHLDLNQIGFGIYIAGPSATADIAQILVRGAHGPSKMEVWFYNDRK